MINSIEINNLFEKLGYVKKILSNNSICYMKGNLHCKFEHVSSLNAYILSSAENSNDANRNLFEDDELYSDLLNEKSILNQLEADLKDFF